MENCTKINNEIDEAWEHYNNHELCYHNLIYDKLYLSLCQHDYVGTDQYWKCCSKCGDIKPIME